ncbi:MULTISPECIES: hypothetical protein [unclassified Paenibacillus]|uniref:hypothetical protein n=1 Tax=unclassified Paenibacillus TaxID=185978 RepID=UPI00301B3D6F
MKLRRTKNENWFEIRSQCPICGHSGWCAINREQTIVHCMRVPSDEFIDTAIGRQFKHYLDPNAVPKTKIEIELSQSVDKKPNYQLDRVYRALASEISLSPDHAAHLRHDRKMDMDAIRSRGYRTMPTQERYKIAKSVIRRLNDQSDLLGVPGFYCVEGQYGPYWTMSGAQGLMIPYRSVTNEITGWQIRVDKPMLELHMKGHIKGEILEELAPENGKRRARCEIHVGDKTLQVTLIQNDKKESYSSSSGQFIFSIELKQGNKYWWWSSGDKLNGSSIGGPLPVHLALPHQILGDWAKGESANTIIDCKEVWVTEGPLKADKTADGLQKPCFGIPGVGSFSLLLEPLKQLGCEHVVLAYDADVIHTPEVQMALEQCANFFAEKTDMSISLAMWNLADGKGIDDLLDNGFVPMLAQMV